MCSTTVSGAETGRTAARTQIDREGALGLDDVWDTTAMVMVETARSVASSRITTRANSRAGSVAPTPGGIAHGGLGASEPPPAGDVVVPEEDVASVAGTIPI